MSRTLGFGFRRRFSFAHPSLFHYHTGHSLPVFDCRNHARMYEPAEHQKEYTMAYQITDACVACGLCKDACPVEAISEGSPTYTIDPDACIDCGNCAGECPNEAIIAG